MYVPTIQDIYPCLLNHLVHSKQGNVCISGMYHKSVTSSLIELKCEIYAKKVRFQAKMLSSVLELISKG